MYKGTLKFINRHPAARGIVRMLRNIDAPEFHREVADLDFRTPVGLASGFDTAAEYYLGVSAMGCGFEIAGPLAYTQKGGVKAAVSNIRQRPPRRIRLGINITKQPSSKTEDETAHDFLDAFSYAYDFADFTVLNFSSDSIGAVHELSFIKAITNPVLDYRMSCDDYRPVFLRLSHTLSREELEQILDYCLMNGIDGVLVGGASLLKATVEFTKGRMPVIAVTRTRKAAEAKSLLDAGASLVALDRTPGSFRSRFPKSILKLLRTPRK